MLSAPEGKAPRPPSKAWPGDDTGSFDENLFSILKRLRKSLSDTGNLPPYVIFHDTSLREMARVRPADKESFRTIAGVGDHKSEKYGPAFIAEIRAFREEHYPEMS